MEVSTFLFMKVLHFNKYEKHRAHYVISDGHNGLTNICKELSESAYGGPFSNGLIHSPDYLLELASYSIFILRANTM